MSKSVVRLVVAHNVYLDEQNLSHLFDRFYQIDESRYKKAQTGGLGLAIVQSIMQIHGGTAEVENQILGVAFKLILSLQQHLKS